MVHSQVTAFFSFVGLPDLDTFCWHLTDGIHPDPTGCTHFIECSNGYAYRVPCAPGTLFNPDINTCDNHNHVPSCHDHNVHRMSDDTGQLG